MFIIAYKSREKTMLAPNILMIRDETAMGEVMHELELVISKQQLSVRDIIVERVKHEVDNYNNKVQEKHYGLVQPQSAEMLLNTFKLASRVKVDVEKQIEIALSAFESNGFFMLVDDIQAEDLEQLININERQSISFVKLTPLVGG